MVMVMMDEAMESMTAATELHINYKVWRGGATPTHRMGKDGRTSGC
jgi:hypothetical protein